MAEQKAGFVDIASQDFPEQVLQAEQMVLVDFSSDKSNACQIFDAEFAAVGNEYKGRVTFARLYIDTETSLTSEWNVEGIPTVIFYKNGQEINRIKGIVMREKLRKQIEGTLLAHF
ncbi:MAG TPA: thioredoxin family protein [Ktedonobacteraceae bacterium]|nr:thioredoxin family protein [Ktedonobacteraceae bacterium]